MFGVKGPKSGGTSVFFDLSNSVKSKRITAVCLNNTMFLSYRTPPQGSPTPDMYWPPSITLSHARPQSRGEQKAIQCYNGIPHCTIVYVDLRVKLHLQSPSQKFQNKKNCINNS